MISLKIDRLVRYTGVNLASTVVDYTFFLTLTHIFGMPILQGAIAHWSFGTSSPRATCRSEHRADLHRCSREPSSALSVVALTRDRRSQRAGRRSAADQKLTCWIT